MNKRILFAAAAFLFCIPFSSHAAFSFSSVSGGHSVSPSTHPAYAEYFWGGTHTDAAGNWLFDGVSLAGSTSGACYAAAERSGLSDTEDAYCVYDSYLHKATYGSGDLGSGSGGTPTEGTFEVQMTEVSLYQTSFQSRNVDTMVQALQDYFWDKALGLPATDPGYRDVCPLAHFDDADKGYDLLGTTPIVCAIYHHDGVVAVVKPVAGLSASPPSLVSGNSTNLTYSCSNGATSASISDNDGNSGNNVGSLSNAASGSKSVSPTVTTTYTLTCGNSAGSDTDTASVTVYPVLSGSCSVNDTSITKGGSVTWSSSASGGTGSYSYSWSGTDSLSGSGSSVNKTYSSTGTKTASVTVTSGSQTKTISCDNSLTVNNPPLSASCTVSSTAITQNGSSTWTATPSGGAGGYTYTWSGASGTASTASVPSSSTGTKSASVTVTDADDDSKTVSCPSVTVSAAPMPDLTAGDIPASSATPGNVTLASTISNEGNASSGASFNALFQKATNSSGASASDLGYVSTTALGAGSSRSVSKSFSFTAGTYYVRACADKSSSGNAGVIDESDEGNNCGDWAKLTVTAALAASCSVNDTSITTGGQATWTANPSGGSSGYTYSWSGSASGTSQSSSKTFSTADTYSASVTVKDADGTSTGTVSCPSVTVEDAPMPDLIAAPIPPSSDVPGSITLTSNVGNVGTASTGGAFDVLFQKATNSSGSGATDLGFYNDTPMLSTQGNGTYYRSVSKSFSFTAGTYYVRACADKSSSGNAGVIDESDEGNNCGDWAKLTVTAALAASCSVNDTSITTGGQATWTANPSGGSSGYTYSWSGSASGSNSTASVPSGTTGTKSASVTVQDSSGASTGTVSCPSVTVEDAPVTAAADLKANATSASDTSIEPGGSITFSATATNSGNGASDSFPILFQVENGALFNTDYLSGLAAGATSPSVSKAHTFSSAGTYRVRACANYNTSWTAIVTESNYDNNCGTWTTITVANAPAGLSCSASDTSVTQGDDITYTARNGSGTDYIWSTVMPPTPIGGSFAHSSSISVSASREGTYRFQVRNSGVTVTCPDVIVSEEEEPETQETLSCRVSATTVAPGDEVTYTSTPGHSSYLWHLSDGSGIVYDPVLIVRTEVFTTSYDTPGTYIQRVSSAGASSTYCPAVVVGGPVCTNPTASITADKDRVQPGTSVTLTYSASGIDGSCTISGPGVSKSATANACTVGSSTITTPGIITQSTYTISCPGASDSVTINVVPKFEEF